MPKDDLLSPDRYDICFDPRARTVFIYRYLRGGVCGPMTARQPVEDRCGAEAEALRHDLVRTGPWRTNAGGNQYAEAHRITVTA